MSERTEEDADYKPRTFTVKIRRDIGKQVRPNAEQVDGKTYQFTYGWTMDKSDPYPSEIAWIPDRDQGYPHDGPTWIASGDLTT